MRRFVLVTGASSGIGQSACMALVGKGYEVIAGVRNAADMERLRETGQSKIHPLLMDVTDASAIKQARIDAGQIIGDGRLVAIFNNAGIVVSGAVLYIPEEEWQRQLDVNVLGVIRVTQQFFPLLIQPRQPGDDHPRRIINMSSVSGLFASPFLGPYAASKFALEAVSDSLRRELYMYDVQVVLIDAGKITTPIWDKARNHPGYFGPEHGSILAFRDKLIDKQIATSISVQKVDDILIEAVTAKRVRVRYLVMRHKWKFNLIRRLPAAWVDSLIQKNLRKQSGFRPF